MEPKRPGLHYVIRRQVRGDGLALWAWEVIDRKGWTLVSGSVYGPRSKAVENAIATIAACQQAINSRGRKRLAG